MVTMGEIVFCDRCGQIPVDDPQLLHITGGNVGDMERTVITAATLCRDCFDLALAQLEEQFSDHLKMSWEDIKEQLQ